MSDVHSDLVQDATAFIREQRKFFRTLRRTWRAPGSRPIRSARAEEILSRYRDIIQSLTLLQQFDRIDSTGAVRNTLEKAKRLADDVDRFLKKSILCA